MAIRLLTADDILSFYVSRRRGAQYLAVENGEYVYLDDDLIADGTPRSYNPVTTINGTEARILLRQETITDGDRFPDALDDDGTLKPTVAAEMAEIVNQDAGLVLDLVVERARKAAERADAAAKVAADAATARARAVTQVVSMCGGNQSEAARLLGIDQSRVNRLVAKARAAE